MASMMQDVKDSPSGSVPGRSDGAIHNLLQINGLDYRLAPSLSVVTGRTHRKWPASRDTYTITEAGPAETIAFTMSAGAAFIDPASSYIEFDLKITQPGGTTPVVGTKPVGRSWDELSAGGANQLFSSVRLTHPGGREVDRTERYDVYSRVRNQATKPKTWWQKEGTLVAANAKVMSQGYTMLSAAPPAAGDLIDVPSSKDQTDSYLKGFDVYVTGSQETYLGTTTVTEKVKIPLEQISGLFAGNRLLPSFLVAGMRIELETNTLANIMVGTGLSVNDKLATLELSKTRMVLDTVMLTDAATRSLASISAQSGLEMPFEAVHHISRSHVGTAIESYQVTRALSRVSRVVICPLATSRQEDQRVNAYKMAGDNYRYLQVRLGNETFPAEAIRNDASHVYHQTLAAWNLIGDPLHGSALTRSAWGSSLGHCAISLEKSSTLAQTGAPIAANRDLNIDIQNEADGVEKGSTCHIFVAHTQLVTVFLDSVTVRS
jgi:hypothetical protein